MFSMIDTIDKYMKENNIPFKRISINREYFPWYINMALLREVRKSSKIHFTRIIGEYELRYDKNNNLYLLVTNERNRENFVIGKQNIPIKEDFNISGKSEKHLIKMGCLIKELGEDINKLNETLDNDYSNLRTREKINLKYELLDDMVEDKFKEFVNNHKVIEDEVDYEDDLIASTYKIMDYIRYLNELYEDSKVKTR